VVIWGPEGVGCGDSFWREDTEFAEGDAGDFGFWRLRRSRSWGRTVISLRRRGARTFRVRIYKAHSCHATIRRRMGCGFGGIGRGNR
jgi:hypothetical protein